MVDRGLFFAKLNSSCSGEKAHLQGKPVPALMDIVILRAKWL
jgi:hypothetical protein